MSHADVSVSHHGDLEHWVLRAVSFYPLQHKPWDSRISKAFISHTLCEHQRKVHWPPSFPLVHESNIMRTVGSSHDSITSEKQSWISLDPFIWGRKEALQVHSVGDPGSCRLSPRQMRQIAQWNLWPEQGYSPYYLPSSSFSLFHHPVFHKDHEKTFWIVLIYTRCL